MGRGMLRRSLLMAGAAVAMATPAAAWAQQVERVYRVGFVVQPQKQDFAAMFDELERHGFGEGKNLAIDPRGFGIPDDSLHEAAVRVVAAKLDVIYAGGIPAGRTPAATNPDDPAGGHSLRYGAGASGRLVGASRRAQARRLIEGAEKENAAIRECLEASWAKLEALPATYQSDVAAGRHGDAVGHSRRTASSLWRAHRRSGR